MMKQVFVGLQDKRLLSPVSVFSFPDFISGLPSRRPSEQRNEPRDSRTSRHRFSPLTEGNSTQTIRSSRGSDTAELCTACPCTPRAPSNIEALSKAWRSQLWGINQSYHHHQHPVSSPAQAANTLLSVSSELRTLEASCRHVVRAAPFSFQRGRSALPPVICALNATVVDLLTASALVAKHVLYLAVAMLLCWRRGYRGNSFRFFCEFTLMSCDLK